MTRGEPCLVLGLGDAARGDDAVGLDVVAELARRDVEGVHTSRGGRDAAWIVEEWRGYDTVLIVDAMRSGRSPGRVEWVDPGAIVETTRASTHGLGLATALDLAGALGEPPRGLRILGIEGETFTLGASLSPAVRAAVPRAVQMLVSELAARFEARSAGADGATR